jgi:hypothetical protein
MTVASALSPMPKLAKGARNGFALKYARCADALVGYG